MVKLCKAAVLLTTKLHKSVSGIAVVAVGVAIGVVIATLVSPIIASKMSGSVQTG